MWLSKWCIVFGYNMNQWVNVCATNHRLWFFFCFWFVDKITNMHCVLVFQYPWRWPITTAYVVHADNSLYFYSFVTFQLRAPSWFYCLSGENGTISCHHPIKMNEEEKKKKKTTEKKHDWLSYNTQKNSLYRHMFGVLYRT